MFQNINNFSDECLSQMVKDGVPFQGPLIVDNQWHIYLVLVDGNDEEAYYCATFTDFGVFTCSYGLVNGIEQYSYSSIQDLVQF